MCSAHSLLSTSLRIHIEDKRWQKVKNDFCQVLIFKKEKSIAYGNCILQSLGQIKKVYNELPNGLFVTFKKACGEQQQVTWIH